MDGLEGGDFVPGEGPPGQPNGGAEEGEEVVAVNGRQAASSELWEQAKPLIGIVSSWNIIIASIN